MLLKIIVFTAVNTMAWLSEQDFSLAMSQLAAQADGYRGTRTEEHGLELERLYKIAQNNHDTDMRAQETSPEIERLYKAAHYDNHADMRLLLSSGVDYDSATRDGITLLHSAAASGSEVVAKLLIDAGADISANNNIDAETPLHVAALYDNAGIAKALLDANTNISARNCYGQTPLHIAALRGHQGVVEVLLQEADRRGSMSELLAARDNRGETLLNSALSGGITITKMVLDAGANVHLKGENGETPLHRAAIISEEMVELILGSGGDISAVDAAGATVLYGAVAYGGANILKRLLQEGADITATTSDGETLVHVAADRGLEDMIRTLLDAGVDISAKTISNGDTALHRAAAKRYGLDTSLGSAACVKTLLDGGADPNAKTTNGETPLHLAVAATRGVADTSIVKFLLEAGANPSSATNTSETPLHLAIMNGSLTATKLLLDAGANSSAKRSDGKTATILAEEKLQQAKASWADPAQHADFLSLLEGIIFMVTESQESRSEEL